MYKYNARHYLFVYCINLQSPLQIHGTNLTHHQIRTLAYILYGFFLVSDDFGSSSSLKPMFSQIIEHTTRSNLIGSSVNAFSYIRSASSFCAPDAMLSRTTPRTFHVGASTFRICCPSGNVSGSGSRIDSCLHT